jgi:hypothetical protein
VNGEPVAHQERHQRVAGLVVRQDAPLLLGEHLLLLQAGDDALDVLATEPPPKSFPLPPR